MIEQVRDPIKAAMNLSSETSASLDILRMKDYADVIISKRFENHEMQWEFTEETWNQMHQLVTIVLGLDVGEASSIFMSKVMDRPLAILNYKVRRLISKDEKPIPALDELKLFMYNGHDG